MFRKKYTYIIELSEIIDTFHHRLNHYLTRNHHITSRNQAPKIAYIINTREDLILFLNKLHVRPYSDLSQSLLNRWAGPNQLDDNTPYAVLHWEPESIYIKPETHHRVMKRITSQSDIVIDLHDRNTYTLVDMMEDVYQFNQYLNHGMTSYHRLFGWQRKRDLKSNIPQQVELLQLHAEFVDLTIKLKQINERTDLFYAFLTTDQETLKQLFQPLHTFVNMTKEKKQYLLDTHKLHAQNELQSILNWSSNTLHRVEPPAQSNREDDYHAQNIRFPS